MDTFAWGPRVWSFLEDIGYHCDLGAPVTTDSIVPFLLSLRYVLPCVHCRINYERHLQEQPVEPFVRKRQLLRWVFELHERVNKETKKTLYNDLVQVHIAPENRLRHFGFAMLVKKLEAFSSSCSNQHLLDLLEILAQNLDVVPDDMTSTDKVEQHIVFFDCLPRVLCLIPTMLPISKAWTDAQSDQGLSTSDIVESVESLTTFLSTLDPSSVPVPHPCPCVADADHKYQKASASYIPDISHWYASLE
jgi:hypothetical protein